MGFGRTLLDEYSVASHERAAAAQDRGAFEHQMITVFPDPADQVDPVVADEGVRRGTTVEKLAGLKPAFAEDGVIHAGNSSQISDGAAALLVMTAESAVTMGLSPIARYRAGAVTGADPVLMLTGPIPATEKGVAQGRRASRRGRRVRGERGLRPGAAGLAGRDRSGRSQIEPARRCHRAGAPARRVRGCVDDADDQSHARQRDSLRVADHVREGGGTANATLVELID